MIIVALFDLSGYSVRPWALAGETCYCLDINAYVLPRVTEVFTSGGSITYVKWDATQSEAWKFVRELRPRFLISMAPCTDLTVAGAKHFDSKWESDPSFWIDAMKLVRMTPDLATQIGCAWMFENPVGMVSRYWRKPDVYFDPYDYGGYLPPDDVHPEWPQYIPPRDGYSKKTGVWAGGGFVMPGKLTTTVEYHTDFAGRVFNRQTAKLGGKSTRTKQIRSLSPRGFFIAVFEANYKLVTGKTPEIPDWRADDRTPYIVTEPRIFI